MNILGSGYHHAHGYKKKVIGGEVTIFLMDKQVFKIYQAENLVGWLKVVLSAVIRKFFALGFISYFSLI